MTSFGDKPLIVVTAGKDAQDGWLPLQDKMAQLSSNSVHRVLPDVSHASLIEDQHGLQVRECRHHRCRPRGPLRRSAQPLTMSDHLTRINRCRERAFHGTAADAER